MKNRFSTDEKVPLSFKDWLKFEKGFLSLSMFKRFLLENGRQYEYFYYLSYAEYLKEVLNLNEEVI